MKKYRFDPSRSISSSLSIILIMVLSLWVAWFVIRKADETIASAKDSPAINLQKRANNK